MAERPDSGRGDSRVKRREQPVHASQPPSATSTCPVTYDAASEDRNATAAAISSGRPSRPSARARVASSASSTGAREPERQLGLDGPRGDRVDPHARRCHLARRRLGQHLHGRLRRVVHNHRAGRSGERRRRRDVHDAPRPPWHHRAQRRLQDEEDAAHVDVHQPVVVLGPDLVDRTSERHAGIADDRREWASFVDGRDHVPEARHVRDVELDRAGGQPGGGQLTGGGARGVGVEVRDDHVVPAFGQRLNDRAADPAAAAGDQGAVRRVSGCRRHRSRPTSSRSDACTFRRREKR